MACVIRKEHWEVATELRLLGLTLAECLDVADAAFGAAAGCTSDDAPAARGTVAYIWGTRRFRQVKHGQDGWEKNDDGNFSTIVNHGLKLRIAVVNTDEQTGRDGAFPRNKSEKGSKSKVAVLVNSLPLFPGLPPSPRNRHEFEERLKKAQSAAYATWYLCLHFSQDARRAELSLPIEIDDGYFVDFKERIYIIDDNGPVRESLADHGHEVEVNVRRRA